MLELQGKYGKAKIFLDSLEENTISQIYTFLNHIAFTNNIAIMPDTHAGAGTVIGFTMPMHHEMVIPNIVGVDINCGMLMLIMDYVFHEYLTKEQRIDIDKAIRSAIPFGTDTHKEPVTIEDSFWKTVTDKHRDFIMKFNRKYGTSHAPIKFDFHWFDKKCDQIGMNTQRAVQSIGTLGGGK